MYRRQVGLAVLEQKVIQLLLRLDLGAHVVHVDPLQVSLVHLHLLEIRWRRYRLAAYTKIKVIIN